MNLESKRVKTHKMLAIVVLCLFFFEIISTFIALSPAAGAAEVTKGKKTFKVSAYYSPLPGQKNYLRGNYDAEVRLNGEGVRGASGMGVHPGMIAAPKTYPFGTRIQLEGLGLGTVEDRGGAIVSAGSDGQSFDRLDVWMGYGDEGLQRALDWGMRVVEGEILSTSEADSINYKGLRGTSVTEAKSTEKPLEKEEALKLQQQVDALAERDELLNSFPVNVGLGASGDQVKLLQVAFKKLGYYKGNISGVYDQELVNAVLTFQVAKKIVASENETSAGYFGLKTRMTLIDILMNKKIGIDSLSALVLSSKEEVVKEKEQATTEKKAPLLVAFVPISQMELPVKVKEKEDIPMVQLSDTSSVPFIAIEKTDRARLSNTVDFKVPTPTAAIVEDVQAKLLLMGYNPGPVTGKFTGKTLIALKAFQRDNKLPISGKLSPEVANTVHTIFVNTKGMGTTMEIAPKGSRLLSSLQTYLKKRGIYRGEVDGTFENSLLLMKKQIKL